MKRSRKEKSKSKRRNNPAPTVSEALERAVILLQEAGEYDPRASFEEVIATVSQLEKAHGDNMVTLAEATNFARLYAKKYFSAGGGVIVPHDANLYFEGKHTNSITIKVLNLFCVFLFHFLLFLSCIFFEHF